METADLRGAEFTGCDLEHASFDHALLDEAKFERCMMSLASFQDAEMRGTSLHLSSLEGCTFVRTVFENTKIPLVYLVNCSFRDTDVSGLTWYDGPMGVRFGGPSSFDLKTLKRTARAVCDDSELKRVAAFLRGCGLTEDDLTFFRGLMDDDETAESVFISYSHSDEAFASRLHEALVAAGVAVFYAPEHVVGGRKLHEQLQSAIHRQDRLLLVLSERSIESPWVETEIYEARQRELTEGKTVLFPISLMPYDKLRAWRCFDADSGRDLAREVRAYYIPDFTAWRDHLEFEAEVSKLLRALKTGANALAGDA